VVGVEALPDGAAVLNAEDAAVVELAELCDGEVIFYAAPLISGTGQPVVSASAFSGGSIPLQFVDFKQIGEDTRIHALVKKIPLP
jgi:riboflavin biosynthesis pyrimidine reductase